MATTPSFSSTASASSAAGEDPTRTRPRRSPSASTLPATGRSSAAPRDTPSWRTPGASSSPGSGGAGSPACGSSLATDERGRSVRSRRFSPGSLPALHGAFLTQRAVKGSRDLEKGRGAHVEGDQRVGIARGMRKEGRGGGGRAGVDAARGGRGDGARRVLPRRLPTRNSCLSTGVVSGRTTGSSASTARSGGRGSSGPSRTATRPSCR